MTAARNTPARHHAEAPAPRAEGLAGDVLAFVSTQPLQLAALVAAQHTPKAFLGSSSNVDPTAFADAIEQQAELVALGDMDGIAQSLVAQATALVSIFSELSVKAAKTGDIESRSTYYSLALRAQNQANATLKTLIELKQPRQAVFTKNAAISQGGLQQVAMHAPAASRPQAREPHMARNELEALEVGNGSTPLDAGAARSAIGDRTQGEALARVHRPAKQGRQARVVG